jgi:hypothetical protein
LDIIFSFLVSLGLFTLYLAPSFVFAFQKFITKYIIITKFKFTIPFGLFMVAILSYLVPSASWIYFLYFVLYHYARAFLASRWLRRLIENLDVYDVDDLDTSKRNFLAVKSFSLSIYIIYSVSVLWEFPIQITITQNLDAVILSIFRAIAIPFFFYEIYRLGYRLDVIHLISAVFVFVGGLFLSVLISAFGVVPFEFLINSYRVIWFYFLVYLVPQYVGASKTYIKLGEYD